MRARTFSFTVTLCLFPSLADSNLVEGFRASIPKNDSKEPSTDEYKQQRTLVSDEKKEFETPVTESSQEVKSPSNPHHEDNGTKSRTKETSEKSWTDIPAQLNERICDYGWIGESCTESVFCVIVEPTEAYFARVPKNSQVAMSEENEDIFGAKKRTTCLSTCHISEADRVAHHENNSYHFVPIESECNLRKGSGVPSGENEHRFLIIIGSLGILLSAAVFICIVFIWIYRNSRTTVDDGNTDTEYDDVCCNPQRIPQKVTEPEYDDADICNSRRISDVSHVCDHRPLPEETTESENEYAYSDVSNVR